MRAVISAVLALLLLFPLAGCELVYKLPTRQGNVLDQKDLDKVQIGMNREQVRFLLGTPMLASMFHQDRWDYVYYLKRGKGAEMQSRKLVVYFKDNRLERFDADTMPPETQADNLILGRNPKDTPKTPPGKVDTGSAIPPAPTRD